MRVERRGDEGGGTIDCRVQGMLRVESIVVTTEEMMRRGGEGGKWRLKGGEYEMILR